MSGTSVFEQRQEHPLGRLAEEVVLLRRQADDRRGIDRVAAVGDGRGGEDGVAIGQRVEAGVVAEGAFEDGAFEQLRDLGSGGAAVVADRPGEDLGVEAGPAGIRADVALDHDLRLGGHVDVDRLRADEPDRRAVQEAGEQQLADARRQRRGGGVGQHALAAEHDRAGHAGRVFAAGAGGVVVGSPRPPVAGAVVVDVPVHRRVLAVDQLGPVHADVPRRPGFAGGFAGVVGVDGVDAGERDVAAATRRGSGLAGSQVEAAGGGVSVVGPALDHGQRQQVDVVAGVDDLLAGTTRHHLRWEGGNLRQLQAFLHLRHQRGRRLGLDEGGDAGGEGLEASFFAAECQLDPLVAAEGVHQQRARGLGSVGQADVLEEQRVAAGAVVQRVEGRRVG